MTMWWSCAENTPEQACAAPQGIYWHQRLIDDCPDILPLDDPYYALELRFMDSTRARVANGFESFNLQLTRLDACTFNLAQASQSGDMQFVVENDSTLILMDTAWTQLKTPTRFYKAKSKTTISPNLAHHINECMIAGTYTLYRDQKSTGQRVDVLFNGQLNGMKPYFGYALCIAGDCLEEAYPPELIITFSDNQGQSEQMAYRIAEDRTRIQFFTLSAPQKDVKGERTVGPMAFEWVKE